VDFVDEILFKFDGVFVDPNYLHDQIDHLWYLDKVWNMAKIDTKRKYAKNMKGIYFKNKERKKLRHR